MKRSPPLVLVRECYKGTRDGHRGERRQRQTCIRDSPYPADPSSAGSYPPGSYSARTESWRTTLPCRSRRRLIAGVCGGLAEHWGVSPTLVRLATLLLALLPGPMWLVYAAAWIVMPDAD